MRGAGGVGALVCDEGETVGPAGTEEECGLFYSVEEKGGSGAEKQGCVCALWPSSGAEEGGDLERVLCSSSVQEDGRPGAARPPPCQLSAY